MSRHAVFLLNLLQDVNIVRPMALLCAEELRMPVRFLASHKFIERDTQGTWRHEVQQLCDTLGSTVHVYDSPWAAVRTLLGHRGVLVSASESDLSAHAHTHQVFRAAPPGWLRVTLQHGYECVGFLQNRDHVRAHGRHIRFAADVICGWGPLPYMRSVAPSERDKFVATGPTALLTPVPAAAPLPAEGSSGSPAQGIVCENLHSVRLRMGGDFKASFMDTWGAFCERLAAAQRRVTLRPHPGGQYVLKHGVPLPPNCDLDNRPMYRLRLADHAFGISAPSSVLIDMVLAGIPTAVWQDADGVVDASHYEGLTTISGLDDWLAFERDAHLRPGHFQAVQQRFIARSGLLVDPVDVRRRFLRLLQAVTDT